MNYVTKISSLLSLLLCTGGLFPAQLFASTGTGGVDSALHERCLKAADYAGCVQVGTSGVADSSAIGKLRNAMKQVSSRLSSGTSLRDATTTFQPVIDAHAVVPTSEQNTLAYQAASMAIDLFGVTKTNWNTRIQQSQYNRGSSIPYLFDVTCKLMDKQVDLFNALAGKKAVDFRWKPDGGLGLYYCKRLTDRPENLMYRYVIGVLRDGATDPSQIKQYQDKRAEAIRLAKLGPWKRYLESRPDLKVWAEANPKAAVKAQEKFNAENPADPVDLPPLPETMPYLQGSRVEKYLSQL